MFSGCFPRFFCQVLVFFGRSRIYLPLFTIVSNLLFIEKNTVVRVEMCFCFGLVSVVWLKWLFECLLGRNLDMWCMVLYWHCLVTSLFALCFL